MLSLPLFYQFELAKDRIKIIPAIIGIMFLVYSFLKTSMNQPNDIKLKLNQIYHFATGIKETNNSKILTIRRNLFISILLLRIANTLFHSIKMPNKKNNELITAK